MSPQRRSAGDGKQPTDQPGTRALHATTARRRASLAVTVAAVLVAVTAIGVVPLTRAVARPIEENFSITVAGEFGNKLFTPRNSWITVDQSGGIDDQTVSINVLELITDTPQMSFAFSSRKGSKQNFAIGYYGDAQRYPFTDPGRPGISMSPLGFCNDQSGNFEVRDIQWSGLAITKLWITYQRYCDDVPAFGEIRLGYLKSAYDVSPRVIRWPEGTYPKKASYDVPITLRTTSSSAVNVTSVTVTGRYASTFPIRQNGCSGALTTAGCVIRVGFTPQGPGPRHALLRVVTTAGTTYVSLEGSGALGQTNWLVDVDYEDPSMPDEHLELPYSVSWGGPYEFNSQAFGADGILWQAFFDLAGNATFTKGHYAYSPDGTGLQMRLARGSQSCEIDRATTDIADLAFTGPDQRLALLDLNMDVHCRASYGQTVHGRIRFHDRDDQTAPGRVTGVSAVRDGGYVILRWTKPAAADLAGVIVRWYPGRIAPGATDVGNSVYTDTGSTVRFAAPSTRPIAVSIWTYDQTGNVGSRYGLQVAP